jgi:hypothetical protein
MERGGGLWVRIPILTAPREDWNPDPVARERSETSGRGEVEEIKPGAVPRDIATADDLEKLQLLLIKDFGGVTVSTTAPSLIGWGARDRRKPRRTRELNKHACFLVYAAAVRASDEYFLALQSASAEALVEGVMLVERQDVTIL